jgi:hypothetical protein
MISGSDYMKDDKPPHICEQSYQEQKPAQEYACEHRGTRVTWMGRGWKKATPDIITN